jgi:hypothetical protein
MNGGDHDIKLLMLVERSEFYAGRRVRQAKRRTKAHAHISRRQSCLARPP